LQQIERPLKFKQITTTEKAPLIHNGAPEEAYDLFEVPSPPEESFVEDTGSHGSKRLVKGAVSMFAGRLLNFGLQAAYFILLARLLHGAREYGLFSGVFAFVSAVTPYSAAGSAMLFMRYVSSNSKLSPVYWGNALVLTSAFTLVMCVASLLLGVFSHFLAHPYLTAILLLANCLFSQVTVLAGMLLFSLDKLRMSAILNTVSNAARFLVVVLLKLSYSQVSASYWSVALTVASLAAAVYSYWQVHKVIGVPRYDLRLLRSRLGEGFGFSFAGSTEAVNNDIDKMMLAHFQLDLQNGFYTLAYRIIDFATAPIGSICASVTQRQFQLAHKGIGPVMRLARKSTLVSIGIGLLIILPIIGVARFIPLMVGPSYSGVVQVLYWLCWLPAIRSVHQLAGAAVTGLGRQPLRTAAQASAAVLSVILNLLWIPRFGWKGAAVATLLCDGVMALLNVGILLYLKRKISRLEELTFEASSAI
jgi:O-antigen/teichoic acid export membrane protein